MSPKILLQPLNSQIQGHRLISSYLSHLLSFKARRKVSIHFLLIDHHIFTQNTLPCSSTALHRVKFMSMGSPRMISQKSSLLMHGFLPLFFSNFWQTLYPSDKLLKVRQLSVGVSILSQALAEPGSRILETET